MRLFHGNIYKYLDPKNPVEKLCIYICDTNLKDRICVIPMDDAGRDNEFKIKATKKVAYPDEWVELNRNYITTNLMLGGRIAKVTFDEYVQLSDIILEKLNNKLLDTYKSFSGNRLKSQTKKYVITEDFYKYITWFEHKSNLQFKKEIKKQPGILRYGLYYVDIGENIGTELHKLRPCVIFKKCQSKTEPNDSSYIVIPVTSQHTSAKYQFNTPIIVNGKINYIRINDIRRVSIKRIVSPLYESGTNNTIVLNEQDIKNLISDFKEYYIGNDE